MKRRRRHPPPCEPPQPTEAQFAARIGVRLFASDGLQGWPVVLRRLCAADRALRGAGNPPREERGNEHRKEHQ